jgi:hypothetical protein
MYYLSAAFFYIFFCKALAGCLTVKTFSRASESVFFFGYTAGLAASHDGLFFGTTFFIFFFFLAQAESRRSKYRLVTEHLGE